MKAKIKNTEDFILKNGFEIDLDEGWVKLASSQFGKSPGRAFPELIQNLIDSYPEDVPWEKRKGEIISGPKSISITDWGEGMDSERLRLLITAGGTDKYNKSSKIGKFGLGFISLFNPGLGTKKIRVITQCEGHFVLVTFRVVEPQKPPHINFEILDEKFSFSTKISLEFDRNESVKLCRKHARDVLRYYPCNITIDDDQVSSVGKKEDKDSLQFKEDDCHGIIRKHYNWLNIKVLCKYEYIMSNTLASFLGGSSYSSNELDICHKNKTPFILGIDIIFNINKLNVTISRDSFYLDSAYTRAKKILNKYLREFLSKQMRESPDSGICYANQYIFREDIGECMNLQLEESGEFDETNIPLFIQQLINQPVYKIYGRKGKYSLLQLKNMLTNGLPIYFSSLKRNIRWLDASYKHDFVVIPDEFGLADFPENFMQLIFKEIFNDIVNLDTVKKDKSKIDELLERGLISQDALTPIVGIKPDDSYKNEEKKFISELNSMLNKAEILETIENSLSLRIKSIKAVFFSIKENEAHVSTAIFNPDGELANEAFVSNFLINQKEKNGKKLAGMELLLGLNSEHPYLKFLLESENKNRSLYTISYLAQELTDCQEKLVRDSPFYRSVKTRLVTNLRKVLMANMLK